VNQSGRADGAKLCSLSQRYFFELIKTRAVTASCQLNPERDRALVRLDADVGHINGNIAACAGRAAPVIQNSRPSIALPQFHNSKATFA
jgi:hypothetical protein